MRYVDAYITSAEATADGRWVILHAGDDRHWTIRADAITEWEHGIASGRIKVQTATTLYRVDSAASVRTARTVQPDYGPTNELAAALVDALELRGEAAG